MKFSKLLFFLILFYSCSNKSSEIQCHFLEKNVKSCSCSDSKRTSLVFKSNRLETFMFDEGDLIYSIYFYTGTNRIKYILVGNKQDDSYYTVNFKENQIFIDKHNVSLNEILSFKENNLKGYDYSIYYYLKTLKAQSDVFRMSTDSLNQLLPYYCYYEYDRKKSTYNYISEVLTEDKIKDDSLVFRYFEVDNLNDLIYYDDHTDGTVRIKSTKKKKSNLLLTNGLTFNHGSAKALVGELHVYFKRNQQLDSINLLLVFQGDLQARMIEFNRGCNALNKKFRSDDITQKKKICNELKKFGITFKNGKAIMSESLMSSLDI